MHPAQRLTGAVRLCALVHEGVAVLQELHRRLLDVLNSLARHGCRGTELRENLPREERHSRPNAPCLVQAGPTGAEAVGVSSPCAHSRDVASLPDLGKETRILKGVARVPRGLFSFLLSFISQRKEFGYVLQSAAPTGSSPWFYRGVSSLPYRVHDRAFCVWM